jgi:hypothetical protein
MADDRMVVFVHGWSVQNTDTYGQLPQRLAQEAQDEHELSLDIRHILLGKYISFRNEVRLQDISKGFQRALEQELQAEIIAGRRFVCITHSTGGPVVRDWWDRFYREPKLPCPMSHLIMLAPANFGSALAQLGKSAGARLKTAVLDGVQPGLGVLDWLELGSAEAWELNSKWVTGQSSGVDDTPPVFPFVLTGQSIDRKLYDNLNSYTDESGSDGVVRTAAANLNATYFRLEQGTQEIDAGSSAEPTKAFALNIVADANRRAPRTAFALIAGRSHSGDDMGIMRSVKNNGRRHPTVDAVLKCLIVSNPGEYAALCDAFDADNKNVREAERLEQVKRVVFLPDSTFFHDSHTMVIFRVRDDRGYPIEDFDLTFIGQIKRKFGANFLPKGFFVDRQKNSRERGVLTYYFSFDAMMGAPAVKDPKTRKVLRDALPGADGLGLEIRARPDDGFVGYVPGALEVSKDVLQEFIKADETVLVDIVLRRVVHEGVFRFTSKLNPPEDFTSQPHGDPIP